MGELGQKACEVSCTPWVLVRADAHVLQASPGARVLLRANADFVTTERGVFSLRGNGNRLRDTLTAALAGQSSAFAIRRASRLPLTVRASAGPDGHVLLRLRDPELTRLDERALAQMFELTTAEAAVVTRVGEGQTLARIAAELGVQANTVQAHVKRALAKTGTHRQAELVALVWRCGATAQG